jgi:hypothetical protein
MTTWGPVRLAFLVAVLAGGVLAGAWLASRHGHAPMSPDRLAGATGEPRSPTPGTETTPLVFTIATNKAEPLPIDHLFSPVPLGDGSILVADPTVQIWEVIRIDGTTVEQLPLPWPLVYPSPSTDGRLLAYTNASALHVYTRATRSDKMIQVGADPVGDQIVWSPDDARIALAHVGKDGTRVEIVDVATGVTHLRAYSTPGPTYRPQDQGLTILGWTSADEFRYRVWSPYARMQLCCEIAEGGTQYADTTTTERVVGVQEVAGPWSACGPRCGLPPAGYEGLDGVVSWCAQTPTCQPALGVVDRAAGTVREIAGTEYAVAYAVSPDRSMLALALRDNANRQTLRLIDLGDFSEKDYALPFVNEGHAIRWFPDGHALMLYFPGT